MKEEIPNEALMQNNGSEHLKPWKVPTLRILAIDQSEEGPSAGGDQGWLMS